MARIDTLTNFLTDVAAAIKAKKNTTDNIPAANFDIEIANLPSGDDTALKGLIERSLTSLTIPDGVTTIGGNAFNSFFGLASVTIPDSVTSISYSAFLNSGLKSVTIPDSVTYIGYSAFSGCASLTSITIPDGVTEISYSMFYNCTNLTSVTIGNGATHIANYVFLNCSKLAIVDFSNHTAVPTLASTEAFSNTPSSLVIKVPAALLDEWKAATNWATFADRIVGV